MPYLFFSFFTILPLVRPLLSVVLLVLSFSLLSPLFPLCYFFCPLFFFTPLSPLFGLLLLSPTYLPFYCCPSCSPPFFVWPFLLLLLLFGLFILFPHPFFAVVPFVWPSFLVPSPSSFLFRPLLPLVLSFSFSLLAWSFFTYPVCHSFPPVVLLLPCYSGSYRSLPFFLFFNLFFFPLSFYPLALFLVMLVSTISPSFIVLLLLLYSLQVLFSLFCACFVNLYYNLQTIFSLSLLLTKSFLFLSSSP